MKAMTLIATIALCYTLSPPSSSSARLVAAGAFAGEQVTQVPASCIPPGFGETINRPIDSASNGCGLSGQGTEKTAAERDKQEAQNQVKNNFCAWTNGAVPALVTTLSFDRLQSAIPANFPWDSRMPTAAERAALQGIHTTTEGDTIGEGSYVQYVGYLLEGHFAGAESVTCGRNKRQDIDIHLAFTRERPWTLNLADRHRVECSSISAEISGHHRPIDWDFLGRMTKSPAVQKLIGAQAKLADEDLQRPMRIRGQLFFDASHGVCSNGVPGSGDPARRSGWEIHPVYSIDVCRVRTLSSCDIDDENDWTPLADRPVPDEQ